MGKKENVKERKVSRDQILAQTFFALRKSGHFKAAENVLKEVEKEKKKREKAVN